MKYLGLDLASRISGWTCGDGAQVPISNIWHHPKVSGPDGADYGKLLSSLKECLDLTFGRFPDIGAVGYEAPILVARGRGERQYGDKLSTLRLLYPLGAFVEWYCRDIAKVPCHEVSVAAIKSEVTGNRHADKEDLAQIAEKCGVILPAGEGRLDASDSWGAWLILVRHYDKIRSAEWDRRIWTPRGALL